MDLRVLVRRILQSDHPCFRNQLAVRVISLERGEFFLEFHHHDHEDDDLNIKEIVKAVAGRTFTLASRTGLVPPRFVCMFEYTRCCRCVLSQASPRTMVPSSMDSLIFGHWSSYTQS